jgi:hypothetical protein
MHNQSMDMTPEERFNRAQDDSLPKEDLTPYEGLWVALRNGYVIAAALDPRLVREDPAVRIDDVLLAVPRGRDSILIV